MLAAYLQNRSLATTEALLELSEDDSVWPGSTQDDRLRHAYVQFASLCKQCNISAIEEIIAGLQTSCLPELNALIP